MVHKLLLQLSMLFRLILMILSLLLPFVAIYQHLADSPLIHSMLFHPSKDSMIALLICTSVVMAVLLALGRWNPKDRPCPNAVEPPMVSSWLPWFGSAFDFLADPLVFFKKYSNQYDLLFKFKLFGQTFVAISSPTAVSNLLRDHSGSFDVPNGQVIPILVGIKLSKDRVPHLYSQLLQKGATALRRGLAPSRLPAISSRLTEELMKTLKQRSLSAPPSSLKDFICRTYYYASCIALFGPNFPLQTYEDFMIFDEGSPLYVRHLGTFARAATAARESAVACWTHYLIKHWVPEKNGYLDGAVDTISDIYRGLKQADLTHDEVHRLMWLIFWAFHANVMDLTFWVMFHITTDKDVYKRICQEIREYVDEKFSPIDNINHMDPKVLDGDDFQFLNSVVQEVMRTKIAFGPMRVATRDTVIMDEKDKAILLRKGEFVVANLYGMHFSPTLQEEPEVFKADRFAGRATPTYSLSYVFGGGKHGCAGRNYANFVVRQFVVLTLVVYDIRAVNGPGSLLETARGLGINFVRPKGDINITFHKRTYQEASRIIE